MAIQGINAAGTWTASDLEKPDNNGYGMMFRNTANISEQTKNLGDKLNTILNDKSIEVDNPLILGQITALSGNYNMARQLQSNIMKSIKDTAQALIRNV
ncbi:TPA: type III secretion apparatus needle protein [Providencia alcalifaciens]